MKLEIAADYLVRKDSALGSIIRAVGPLADPPVSSEDDHVAALARIIVGQQLSTRVAQTIWQRVVNRLDGKVSGPSLLALSPEEMRSLGLSAAKSRYLQQLAEYVADGRLDTSGLVHASDEEVQEQITQVPGLGPWSAHMFLMFHLHRPDVLAWGDLGVREAVRRLYQLPERPTAARLQEISQPWRPFRTLACRYLWRYLDAAPGLE